MKLRFSSVNKDIASILNRLNTSVLIVSLFILTSASIISMYISTVKIMTTKLTLDAKNNANRIEWVIKSYKNIAQGIGSIQELSNPHISTAVKEVILANKSNEYKLSKCKIINPDGYSDMDTLYRGDREYFKEALKGNVYIDSPIISRYDGQLLLLISAPIWKNGIYNGRIDSVLLCSIYNQMLNNIIKELNISKNSDVYIIGKDGKTIASFDEDKIRNQYSNIAEAAKNKKLREIARFEEQSLRGKKNTSHIIKNGNLHCYTSHLIEGTPGWALIIDAPFSDFLSMFWVTLIFTLVISVIIILISRHLLRKHSTLVSEPIQQMAERLRQASIGDFKSEVSYDNSLEEVKIIANATQSLINRMDSVLNGINSNSTPSELTRFIDFTNYIPLGENFEKVMHVHLCLLDSKMNRILGTIDENSMESYSESIMVNNRCVGKYIMSPNEGCLLSGDQIQLTTSYLAILVGKIIENILSREIRYKAWQKNEIINNEKLMNNSEKMSREILEWTSEFVRSTLVNGNKEIRNAAKDFEKKILQFNSRIQENSEFSRLTNYDTNIWENDYEFKYLLENLEIRKSRECENKDNITINSKEKPEDILFGDRKAIEKVIMRIILFLEDKNKESEINVLASTQKETFGHTLQFKFRIEHHSMKKEDLKAMKAIENRSNNNNGPLDSEEQRLLAAYNLLWLMNGTVSFSVDEECCFELIVKIPQL